MIKSILDSTKKSLGILPEDLAWDDQIIMHINSVFSTLTQLGLGPSGGFMIEDKETEWDEFLEEPLRTRLNNIQTYMHLRVRLLVDPPQTGYLVEALKEQIRELEARMSITREDLEWTDPSPEVAEDEMLILDGGSP